MFDKNDRTRTFGVFVGAQCAILVGFNPTFVSQLQGTGSLLGLGLPLQKFIQPERADDRGNQCSPWSFRETFLLVHSGALLFSEAREVVMRRQ